MQTKRRGARVDGPVQTEADEPRLRREEAAGSLPSVVNCSPGHRFAHACSPVITREVIERHGSRHAAVVDADPTTTPDPPILFLHGVFGTPTLLEPWTHFLESAGPRARADAARPRAHRRRGAHRHRHRGVLRRRPGCVRPHRGTGHRDRAQHGRSAWRRRSGRTVTAGRGAAGARPACKLWPRLVAAAPLPDHGENPCGQTIPAIGEDDARVPLNTLPAAEQG